MKYNKKKVDINNAIRLYENGLSQIEVAKILGITQKVLWARFKEVNYKCRIAAKRNQWGEFNSSWKGKEASYAAKHYRIYKLLGMPRKCEICGIAEKNKRYEWANLTGKFDEPKDYKRMCKKCHHNYDLKSHKKDTKGMFVGGDAKCVN